MIDQDLLRWVSRLYLLIGSVFIFILISPGFSQAANFQMKTGYYVGSGSAGLTISNIGFQPEFVLIKSDTATGVGVFKTSAMPSSTTAFLSATADNTASQITLTPDGFSVGTIAQVNSLNVRYTYIAITGSDCTSAGTFCVGQYAGNGSASRTITTGFQPSLVIIKRQTAVASHFRTASMPINTMNYFTSTAQDTTGTFMTNFTSSGFTVGANNNVNASNYYYVTFPVTIGIMAEGTYTGNGVDNRNVVTALGFEPDMVLVKNTSSATANNRRAVMNLTTHYGDMSTYVADAVAGAVNLIQDLQINGFQIGSGVNVNENTSTFYWFAFGGSPLPSSGSGTFLMKTGVYTGTGTNQTISGIGFQPDLVIIKSDSTQFAVFRTRMMRGDITAHLSSATTDFAGGITSLTGDGFTLGSSLITNTTGSVYQYQAFGNAYNPYTNTGASDFAVGLFYGNGIDNRDIEELPFTPGLVTIKRNSTSSAAFRVSANTGDQSNVFGATAQAINLIQNFNSLGFQVGTSAQVNNLASNMYWFAFAEGANFDAGSYTGNGVDNRNITLPGFNLSLLWIKSATAVNGVMRGDSLTGDITQYFTNLANVIGRIKNFITAGFQVGTQSEVNTNGVVYYYGAWRDQNFLNELNLSFIDSGGSPIGSPSISFPSLDRKILCQTNVTTLGDTNSRLRVTNSTANPQWNITIAATTGSASFWDNQSGGIYDFNDNTGMGCQDGSDIDSIAGQLTVSQSSANITPQSGCSNTGIALGSNTSFLEGSMDSITLVSANSSTGIGCYWDITDIGITQTIPAEQVSGGYTIDFTISVVSF